MSGRRPGTPAVQLPLLGAGEVAAATSLSALVTWHAQLAATALVDWEQLGR